jgi:CheY-like chemotaxis protein
MIDKILCVDDDPITLMLCRKVIEKAGFASTTDSATNGEDALRYFDGLMATPDTQKPSLIFLDLNMPVMGGWEFLDHFSAEPYKAVFPEVKVIVLSSTIDPHDIEKASTYPMVLQFMSKPITIEMLEDLKSKL